MTFSAIVCYVDDQMGKQISTNDKMYNIYNYKNKKKLLYGILGMNYFKNFNAKILQYTLFNTFNMRYVWCKTSYLSWFILPFTTVNISILINSTSYNYISNNINNILVVVITS